MSIYHICIYSINVVLFTFTEGARPTLDANKNEVVENIIICKDQKIRSKYQNKLLQNFEAKLTFMP